MPRVKELKFQGGPLDGTTTKVGRMATDIYDVPERHGTQITVHRYRVKRIDGELVGTFKATFGGKDK
jgi:hypothetical protein